MRGFFLACFRMDTKGLHVAIVHRRLALGGAEEVSRETSLIFRQMGICTHFFAEEHRAEEWVLPACPEISLTLFPEGVRLWTRESADVILRESKARGIQVVIIPIALPNDQLAYLRSAGLRLIYWCHSSPLWELIDRRERAGYKPHHPWHKNIYSLLIRRTRRLLVPDRARLIKWYRHLVSEVDCFITLAPGYIKIFADSLGLSEEEQKKFVSLPNMVRPPKSEVTLLGRPKKIIFMGRLSYADKRADRLIYIWEQIHRELPEWSVEIYGQGKEEKYLRALIEDKQLPRISLRGYAPDPSLIYPQSSVLAMTSTYEGWGLVLTEAQSYGVVPIAFGCSDGVKEIIGTGEQYGRLVTPFDLDEYATKLRELCLREELRQSLAEASMRRVEEYFPERNIPRWQGIFDQL